MKVSEDMDNKRKMPGYNILEPYKYEAEQAKLRELEEESRLQEEEMMKQIEEMKAQDDLKQKEKEEAQRKEAME